jgi:hypothetical protein
VSRLERPAEVTKRSVLPMDGKIRVLTFKIEDPDGMIITFSDGTTAAYLVEELLKLRPHREETELSAD